MTQPQPSSAQASGGQAVQIQIKASDAPTTVPIGFDAE